MAKKGRKTPPASEIEPAEIRRIREKLGLSQVEAGELLGGGPRAFTKYESGTIKPAASVANMLRLLDADPHVLTTLTGRRIIPIDNEGSKLLEVTGRHIEALSDRKLANLMRRLLAAEAQSGQLPMDGIHVAAVITAPDGGEDARIEWIGGPERTSYLPSRISQFQFKATGLTPAEAAAEVLTSSGDVKPMVRSVLEKGGTYIMICSRQYTNDKIKKRRDSICKALVERGLKIDGGHVQFREASQIALWVNSHPPVAAWVLEQTQPGMVGPFRDWTHWAGRFEHEHSPWVVDLRLESFGATLKALVIEPRGIARVVGLSGVGKSRLVLETLGPTEEGEYLGSSLSNLVLYAVEPEVGTTAITNVVQNLADAFVRAIIVVDRCLPETHQDLAAIVKRTGSRLSLVTIDHEIPPTLSPEILVVESAADTVIDGMLKRVAPNLHTEDHRRLLSFSDGFPQMAILLGQAWLQGGAIASGNYDDLVDRIVWGRNPHNRELDLEIAMLLGVFGLLGVKQPRADLDFVAELTRGYTADDLRAALDGLSDRGVLQRRGRLVSLQPRPVAMTLAARQWSKWSATSWDEILTGGLPPHLRIGAAHQLSLLNDRQIATEIVQKVSRLDGPLASLEGLQGDGNTQVISSLAEIDAEVVVTLLEHVLAPLSVAERRTIDGRVRRHLVWALQKIAFVSSTFERAALLLLDLAVAENEEWTNNSTGQFKALFPAMYADTAADPAERLRFIDELIKQNDPLRMPIVVQALIAGAKIDGISYVHRTEVHGSRPALKRWQPKIWKDVFDYVRACVNRLSQLARRSDDIGSAARAGIGRELRILIARGLIDSVEGCVRTVVAVHRYWPEALNTLGNVLRYDHNALEVEVQQRVQSLISALTPNDLADRVRFLVTEMPWDYPSDETLDFEEKGRRQVGAIEQLVHDLIEDPEGPVQFFQQLSCGDQRMSFAFGRALAKEPKYPSFYQAPVRAAVEAVPEGRRNFGLLAGYFSGLSEREPDIVDAFKQEAVKSAALAPGLPIVCASIGVTEGDVLLVREGLHAGLIPPRALVYWGMGGALAKLPASVLGPLFDDLLSLSADAYSIALDLMGMYVHGRIDHLQQLRRQLRLAATNVSLRNDSDNSQMGAHHFEQMMEWILAKGREDLDARFIAVALARAIVVDSEWGGREFIKPLLPTMLAQFGAMVWSIFGQAILEEPAKAWRIEHVLGDSFSFAHEKKPPILYLQEDILFAWCHANPTVGPAFVASIAPVLTTSNPEAPSRDFHSLVKRLLDEFGEREDVLAKLMQNMHTFGWTGSRTTYYSLYEQPLRSLETHPVGAVRRWAKRMLGDLRRAIETAHNEEEEQKAVWDM